MSMTSLLFTILIVFSIFCIAEYTLIPEDIKVGEISHINYDIKKNGRFSDLAKSTVDMTGFTDDLPVNYQSMNYSERDDWYTNEHGGNKWAIWKWFEEWTGIGWEFTDGTEISANDYGAYCNGELENIDLIGTVLGLGNIITFNFIFLEIIFGFFAYIIRLPIMIIIGFISFRVIRGS